MKKVLALVLAAVMIVGCAVTVFAYGSPTGRSSGSSGSSVRYATTTVSASGVSGTWNYNAATNQWSFADTTKVYKATWALVQNPYANGASQWYYFDINGNMATGWVWIKGPDGITRCYYLNPASNGSLGACFLNGKTADGYTVDATGAWTVNGVVQKR